MTLQRIDLADIGSLDGIADEIHRLAPDIPIPVPVEELARQLDISEVRVLETRGFEGALVTDPEKSNGVILVNSASRIERRRFSIGHELGHFLSPWHRSTNAEGFRCSKEDMRTSWAPKNDKIAEMEVEANRFSARLIMPKISFVRDMRRRQGCELEHVLALAIQYGTSKEATARRYVELHDEPCAAIVSHQGRVLRFYRNEDFPYLDIRGGVPVPRDSITAIHELTAGEITDWDEIDGSTWLPTERGRPCPMLYEQVLVQQDGYRLTLLALVEDDVDD